MLGRRFVQGSFSFPSSPLWIRFAHATTLIALSVYCVWGALLIAQKPGLQYDEAALVANAVRMGRPGVDFAPAQAGPDWICLNQHCLPLMSADYVGAVKEYLSLPLFWLFGPRATSIRIVSLLLGALGIWGVSKLTAEQVSRSAGVSVALILAFNPAYVSMVVFDNNAIGAMMAGLGLVCASLAAYLRRRRAALAFLLGVSIGFAVWARANFVWTILAAGIAILFVYGRKVLIPFRHCLALIAGGVVGGAPFLVFQVFSKAITWRDQGVFATRESMWALLRYRVFLFSDVLFSEGEHRRMWNAVMSLPEWQLWLFPILVAAACLVCLFAGRDNEDGRSAVARAFVLAFLFLGIALFFSRIALAEHHFVAMLPFAAVIVVLACLTLQSRYAWGRFLTVGLALFYCGAAVNANVSAIRGLRRGGGIGDWSDGAFKLARYLDEDRSPGTLMILDWGFQDQLYVLTNGRLKSRELFWGASGQLSDRQQPWAEVIREGGRFLLPGPENRHFIRVLDGFTRALAELRPTTRSYRVLQRDGSTYGQVIDIEPNSARGPSSGGASLDNEELSLGDPHFDGQLTGFYPFQTKMGLFYQIDQDGWRRTKREFSILIGPPEPAGKGGRLLVHLYVPDRVIRRFGPMTLSVRVEGHRLVPENYRRAGLFTFDRMLPAEWVAHGPLHVDFTLDRAGSAESSHDRNLGDDRDLGILVRTISLDPA